MSILQGPYSIGIRGYQYLFRWCSGLGFGVQGIGFGDVGFGLQGLGL